ncbi:MAG: ATP synthase F1 subunit delta [Calditerrivibrio sp.]|nr:ATP synthase F1 subunit delta [Calditerrivibrio sp.]MCA1932675.1 ATP synthase F1 subunit delta [Calditerrivibrio sp.]MCA1980355.1 ATP synthase F1 subunit delta [Calditerrivibrio sp.]
MKDIVVSKRYALALYSSLKGREEKDKVVNDIVRLNSFLAENIDFSKLVKNPMIKKEEKSLAISSISKFLGFSKELDIFLSLLVEKNRLNLIQGICESIVDIYNEESGCVDAEVVLPIDIKDDIKAEITDLLSKLTAKKVNLIVKKDRSIIGGFTAKVKSNLYDASIKGQLERLSDKMMEI